MSCGPCGVQASHTMQGDTGVPAGAPTTAGPRCPYCQAFVTQAGAPGNNPRCPGPPAASPPTLPPAAPPTPRPARQEACQQPQSAYSYARGVDQAPRAATRAATRPDPHWAYEYDLWARTLFYTGAAWSCPANLDDAIAALRHMDTARQHQHRADFAAAVTAAATAIACTRRVARLTRLQADLLVRQIEILAAAGVAATEQDHDLDRALRYAATRVQAAQTHATLRPQEWKTLLPQAHFDHAGLLTAQARHHAPPDYTPAMQAYAAACRTAQDNAALTALYAQSAEALAGLAALEDQDLATAQHYFAEAAVAYTTCGD